MAFLAELFSSTVQFIIMLAVAVGCFCLGAAISKNRKKKSK